MKIIISVSKNTESSQENFLLLRKIIYSDKVTSKVLMVFDAGFNSIYSSLNEFLFLDSALSEKLFLMFCFAFVPITILLYEILRRFSYSLFLDERLKKLRSRFPLVILFKFSYFSNKGFSMSASIDICDRFTFWKPDTYNKQ